jgi:hypothetical protein
MKNAKVKMGRKYVKWSEVMEEKSFRKKVKEYNDKEMKRLLAEERMYRR